MVYVPKALGVAALGVAAEHVVATRRNKGLLLETSQVNLELLRRRLLR
jgi:hypothetical protein